MAKNQITILNQHGLRVADETGLDMGCRVRGSIHDVMEIGAGWHQPPHVLDDILDGRWVEAAINRNCPRRVRYDHEAYSALDSALLDDCPDLVGDVGQRVTESRGDRHCLIHPLPPALLRPSRCAPRAWRQRSAREPARR